MTRIAFLNGEFLPFEEARVPISDRGFNFGDGVYEVTAVIDGQLVDNPAHLTRLDLSLDALDIPNPFTQSEWHDHLTKLIAANGLRQGVVYLQVTRGVAERDFAVPSPPLTPTVVMFTQTKNILDSSASRVGIKVATIPELRWARRDVKSISLVGAVLAKHLALRAGNHDVWFVEDEFLTEGGSSNIFIVAQDGTIITREISKALLGGITRRAVLSIAESSGMGAQERAFTVQEALMAREAFVTSASTFITPVVSIDGQAVGTGEPGPITRQIQERYIELARTGGGLT